MLLIDLPLWFVLVCSPVIVPALWLAGYRR
jgi:hypothetical protein